MPFCMAVYLAYLGSTSQIKVGSLTLTLTLRAKIDGSMQGLCSKHTAFNPLKCTGVRQLHSSVQCYPGLNL